MIFSDHSIRQSLLFESVSERILNIGPRSIFSKVMGKSRNVECPFLLTGYNAEHG